MLLAAAMNDQRRAMSYRQSLRRMWQKRTDRPVRASHAHRRGVARPRKTHAAILAALLSTAALTGVASADPAAAEAYADYNRGVALYKQGQFEKAAAVFKGVLPRADRTLDAAARYNWGNCAYARGVAQARAGQVDPAIASLDEAIGHYRQALAVHPDDADARANVELASLLIRQLKEDKQQQQQKDQQKDQQKKDQPQKNQDSPKQQDQQTNQDQQQKTTDQQNKQNDQPQDRQQQAPQDQDDAGKQQQHNSQGDQPPEHPQARKDDPSDSQQPKESSQNQDPQQAKKDQQVSDSPQDQQDTPPQEPQDQAQAYKSKPDGSPPPSGPPGQPGQPGQPNSGQTAAGEAARVERARQDGDVTAQEAARLLQAVRDRHLQRRIQTFRNRQARHEPVDQDW
jgi:Ca-activated chloride channel family protein